jgi:hypothetical protein
MQQHNKSGQKSVDAQEEVYMFRECRQAVVSRPIARPRDCGRITRHHMCIIVSISFQRTRRQGSSKVSERPLKALERYINITWLNTEMY